jgi:type II secretion system protein I
MTRGNRTAAVDSLRWLSGKQQHRIAQASAGAVSPARRGAQAAQVAAAAPQGNLRWGGAFTLLEVMIAVAFIGIAMLALLSLHQNNLASVIRAQDLTRASMLAQQLMSSAEVERFPDPGQSHGDFTRDFPGQFNNFRWEREVDALPQFPDMRRVRVTVLYGPQFRSKFDLFEYMHNPNPPQLPNAPDSNNPATAGDDQAAPSE